MQEKEYILFRLAEFLSRCGTRRFAYWLALRLGDAYYRLDEAGRIAVTNNLRQVYAFQNKPVSEADLQQLSRRVFQYFGKYLADFFRFARLSEGQIAKLVRLEHEEHLAEAERFERGVILVTGHIGNWELGGALLASLGRRVNAVALRQPSQRVNDFFQKYRRKRGMNILPLGHAIRDLVAALERRECVALLADRDYSLVNHPCRLFGKETDLPRGAAWLSRKTGAPILMGFMLRRDDDTFVMRFHPPILPGTAASQDELQQRICRILEQEIMANPMQWFVFQSLWNGQKLAPPQASRKAEVPRNA